jgi:hypothetical protein
MAFLDNQRRVYSPPAFSKPLGSFTILQSSRTLNDSPRRETEEIYMRNLQKASRTSLAALLAVAIAAIATSATLSRVHAQNQEDEAALATAALTTYAEFQYATLTGTTNTINASMVPIVTSKGTVYKDLTFQVTVSATGVVAIVAGSPTAVASSITQSAGFKAGTYIAPSSMFSDAGLITVSGPGITAGGATVWSLATAAGANSCTYPSSATWYVGAPTAANNPLAARLKKAGITSTAYSYGLLGVTAGCVGGFWDAGALLGLSQSGNAITISSFTNGGSTGTDYSTPEQQITFTLK